MRGLELHLKGLESHLRGLESCQERLKLRLTGWEAMCPMDVNQEKEDSTRTNVKQCQWEN